MNKPHILLTNDDGIAAPGLKALHVALAKIARVTVVAPESEKSAIGHGITIWEPLRVSKRFHNDELYGYAVRGTPADCVKFACLKLLSGKPDLVVSGINYGSNTGVNVVYSGTVAGALEGAIMGYPAIAVSLTTFKNADFSCAARFAQRLSLRVLEKGLPPGTILNVNVPNLPEDEIKGVAITRMGDANFEDNYEKRTDPHNTPYYWLTGSKVVSDDDIEHDDGAVRQNMISVCPLHFDLTNHEFLGALKTWGL